MSQLSSPFATIAKRAWDLGVSYYQEVGQLTLRYWQDLSKELSTLSSGGGAATRHPPGPSPAQTVHEAPASTLLLSAAAGKKAVGAFLVSNGLDRPVSTPIESTEPTDEAGGQLKLRFAFEPSQIELGPGEQQLVQVSAKLPKTLDLDRTWRGEFSVPGLPGTRVPYIVRRRSEG